MKHEEALCSHQGIVRSNKPHLLYCLVYGSWCYIRDLHYFIISYIFFFLSLLKLKGCCSIRHIEIFSFFLHKHLSICVGCFSAMSFYKKRLVNSSQTSQWLPFSENVVCIIVIFFYLPFVSIWFEKLHIAHCIQLFIFSSLFQICNVPLSLSCLW